MKNKKLLKVVSLMALSTTCVTSGVLALNTKVANAASEGVFHELGASVRVSSDKGIRFAFGLPEDKTGDGYEIGTLIVPKAVLGDAELNHNDDTADEVDVDYAEIDCTKKWVPNDELFGAKDGYKYYNAALTEIPSLQYNTVLVARSYYVKDGVYTYSDPVERSIGYVASAALNDGYEDTKEILTDIVKTGYGETALTVEGDSFITTDNAETFTASNEKGYLPVWSTSNADIATVDKTGKVTAVKGGEATITATIGNVTADKTIYAVGAGLYADQVGIRINGWNFSSNASYLTVSGDNGNMVVTSKFQANFTYAPGLILRNMYSKAYYEALIANGYTKFTFGLAVEGDVTDLYVFGKQVSSFPQKDGVYQIVIDTNQFVSYYDTMHTIATSADQVGQASSLTAKFIAWKSPANDWSSVRNYTFTLSNVAFTMPTIAVELAEGSENVVSVGETTTLTAETNMNSVEWSSSDDAIATVTDGVVTGVKGGEVTVTATTAGVSASKTIYVAGNGIYTNQIGARMNGWNMSSNADYCGVTTGENGETVITSKFLANGTYSPALVLKNMYSKAYYQALIANGYTKLTFGLKVEGDVTDLYVFGKQVSALPQNNGVYAVVVDVQHIVNHYDTMNTIATSGSQVGQASSLAAKFISWKSPANDWSSTRNYVFTIANATFNKAATLAVDFAAGSEATIVAGNTTTLVATSNWDASLVEWTSSDDTIATVVNGVVTGVAGGEATITATLDGVSVSKNITVVAPTLEVDFETECMDMIEVDGTTTLIATTNGNVNDVEWTTSDATIATVEDGIVMGMKGGEATITATLAGVSVSKTVYVVGAGLYGNQLGVHAYGWNQTSSASYFNMATTANNEMTATVKYAGSTTHYPATVLRELYSKTYYEKLIANGYSKLTFTLTVGGESAANVSDLYVFGKKLTNFAKNADGAYAIVLDLQYMVDNYAKVSGIGTSVEAKNAEVDYMLIAWKSTDWTARNYEFTISNAQFGKGVLFADNIGMRVNGWNMTTNTSYMTMDVEADGAMTITANWQAYQNYGPALVLKNIESKAYYQNLINSGITYLTFDLKVGGEDADKLDDIHILGSAQKVSACEKVDGVYKVQIQLAHIVQFYDTITTLDTSGSQAGQWGSRSALLLAWRFSTNFATVPTDATRNYIFTISNSMYV